MPGTQNGEAHSKRILVLDTAALVAGTDSLFTLRGLVHEDGSPLDPLACGELPEFQLVPEVAQEVRDPRARARLQLIRDSAVVRVPTPEALDAVVKFSKATGDYPALSRVDLRVLALAWMVEKETNGTKFLRSQPPEPSFSPVSTVSMQEAIAEDDARAAAEEEKRQQELAESDGWVSVTRTKPKQVSSQPKRKRNRKKSKPEPVVAVADSGGDSAGDPGVLTALESHTIDDILSASALQSDRVSAEGALCPPTSDKVSSQSVSEVAGTSDNASLVEALESTELNEEAEFSDDGVGWINPDNLEEHIAHDLGGGDAVAEEKRRAGCVTTDFAMQNVLIQMGINLVSVDGRRVIRRVKRYVLRCQSCTEVTRELERLFCGRCGNATLTRVTFDVNEDGVARLFLSSKYKPRLRGTKYPIPMPRGGRNNKDLILCEDQIDFQKLRRAEKQRERRAVDVLDPDTFYKVGAKYQPHKPLVVGYGSRNPNEGKPSTKVSRR